MQTLDTRHLYTTRLAPRCPEIDHQDLAAVVIESLVAGIVAKRLCIEVRRLRSNADWRQFVAQQRLSGGQQDKYQPYEKCGDGELLSSGHTSSRHFIRSTLIS